MSIPNLPVDFKDDILNTGVNQKRKYQQTYNSDGSVSFEDVTAYQQKGSNFGAQEVNKTNGAVNNIYAERIVDLDELDLVTEPGFFVDALAVKELNSKLPVTITRLDDGSTDYTYDCCYYPAVGMCVLQLSVNPRVSKTYENGTTYSLYEIAEGYRPSRSAALYCYSSGSAVSNAAINSAGTIRYQPKVSDVQPSQPITISGAWFVD